MTVAVAREYEITYGTLTVGLGTDYHIPGPIRLDKSFEQGVLAFQVEIASQTKSTFESAISTLEAAFTARRVATTWKLGPTGSQTTILSWSHTSNTGFNSRATCRKAGTVGADSGRSRLYDVEIVVGLPASDASGRRDVSITVDKDAAKRNVVRFSGVWTALSSNSAMAQFVATIDSYCSSIISALSLSNMEQIDQTATRDDQDKVVTFTRTYQELLYDQSLSGRDDTQIVKHVVRFERTTSAPGDSISGTKRLEGFVLSYEGWVDKEQTTDLLTVYDSKVRPFLKSKFASDFSPVAWGIVGETRDFERTENRITATWQIQAVMSGTDYIMSTQTLQIVEAGGTVFTGAWNGGIYSKYADQGFAVRQRRMITNTLRFKTSVPSMQRISTAPIKDGNWYLVGNDSSATLRYIGQSDQQFGVVETTETLTWEYAEEPSEESGGPNTTPTENAPPGGGGGQTGPAPTTVSPDGPNPVIGSGGGVTSGGGSYSPAGGGAATYPPGFLGMPGPSGSVTPGLRTPGS